MSNNIKTISLGNVAAVCRDREVYFIAAVSLETAEGDTSKVPKRLDVYVRNNGRKYPILGRRQPRA